MNSVSVRIPTILRPLTGGNAVVQARGHHVLEIIEQLDTEYPGFRNRLLDVNNAVRPFMNIYVEDEDIRTADGLRTTVSQNATISIIPAVAGG